MLTLSPALSKLLSGKQLLIFDFDGTIADTSPLHAQAFTETLAPFGIVVCYQHIAGLRTAEALLSCFDEAGLEPPTSCELKTLVNEKQQRVRELIQTSLQPIPPMDAFLRWAHTRYQMALVTSGSRETVGLALNKLNYQSLFKTQIFAEDVRAGKPDPEGFNLALKTQSCKAGQALVFEDSKAGFQAATAAKLDFVDINHPVYALAA